MHKECGLVTEVSSGKVKVESAPDAGCASCAARGSCMTGSEQRVKVIWIENTLDAVTGDTVFYGIEEKGVVAGALLLYFVPVLFLITGGIIAPQLSLFEEIDPELASAAGGVTFLVVSFLLIRVVSSFFNRKNYFAPRLLEIEGRDKISNSEENLT